MFDWYSFITSPNVFLHLFSILLLILFLLRLSNSLVRLPWDRDNHQSANRARNRTGRLIILFASLLAMAMAVDASAGTLVRAVKRSPKRTTVQPVPPPADVIYSASVTSIRRNELCIFWEYDLSAVPGIKGFRVYDEAGTPICFTENLDSLHLDCQVAFSDAPIRYSMTAYDIIGNESEKSPLVTANKSPLAAIQADGVNRSVSLLGNGSLDYDNGSITQYSWDFGDGSPTETIANTVHTFAGPGNYTVRLTVVDNQGAASIAELPLNII